MTSSFVQLRSQTRSLESQIDQQLAKYASFISETGNIESSEESQVVSSIEDMLKNTENLISSLGRALDAETHPSATKMNQVQRHKEVLADHRNEFKRIKASILQERNRNNLLSSVRSDIETHRSRSVTPGHESQYMLDERQTIDNSHSLADTLLAQAYETRDEFLRQRATLIGVQRRVLTAASHIPGLNTLISKINTRKRRDSLIIAGVITACILFLFFMR